MKIIPSILKVFSKNENIAIAKDLETKDPDNPEEIIKAYEQRLVEQEELFKKIQEDLKK